jgi:hypothetical protein
VEKMQEKTLEVTSLFRDQEKQVSPSISGNLGSKRRLAMKAIVKTSQEAGVFEVKEVPKPKPGRGEVLIQVKAASLCYTDVAILNNKYKGRRLSPSPSLWGMRERALFRHWEKAWMSIKRVWAIFFLFAFASVVYLLIFSRPEVLNFFFIDIVIIFDKEQIVEC